MNRQSWFVRLLHISWPDILFARAAIIVPVGIKCIPGIIVAINLSIRPICFPWRPLSSNLCRFYETNIVRHSADISGEFKMQPFVKHYTFPAIEVIQGLWDAVSAGDCEYVGKFLVIEESWAEYDAGGMVKAVFDLNHVMVASIVCHCLSGSLASSVQCQIWSDNHTTRTFLPAVRSSLCIL